MTKENETTQTGWSLDNSYTQLPKTFFSVIDVNPVRSPKLVVLNDTLASSLGLDAQQLRKAEEIEVLAGNRVPEGAAKIAQAYAGHQFGHFTMLGDGRALLVGEQITPSGDRFDIQLKGSGRTPYSRGGDGRAALGPMLREYIISEAMHALGIPTTRSLSVVTTGETVNRETGLTGAIMTRVAASHLRVGTFEFAAQWGSEEDLRSLADYTISRHYPHIEASENRYLSLLRELIRRQASLIAKWQLVGFIHGVMNTDNMTISGETIDYGPCAFMDVYDPETVFSSIDVQGRYAYKNQPPIGGWNLARLAETLLPLLHKDQDEAVNLAQKELTDYIEVYRSNWLAGMRAKLGIMNKEAGDEALIEDFLSLMHKYRADYTNTFRALTADQLENMDLFKAPEFAEWQKRWHDRLDKQSESKEASRDLMRSSNPAVIPRNHRVEAALEAAGQGDFIVMEKLLKALSDPYAYSAEQAEYADLPEPTLRPYRTFCGT
ncbi:protein adenylyltransferase SelO [Domibacillus robiginosus]|uniref:protein adenylyltransferase SelO n=1 Tax=Domibacillus robiginosus TaxID=1071054 RepID=UPI00067BC40B|nr:YdiU family protein [Domibacillus robiginosus]